LPGFWAGFQRCRSDTKNFFRIRQGLVVPLRKSSCCCI